MLRAFWRINFLLFFFLVILTSIVGWRLYKKIKYEVITRFANHQWEAPSKLYAEPTLLYPGIDIESLGLLEQLGRLDYRPVASSVQTRGEYFHDRQNGALQIFLHDMSLFKHIKQPQRVKLKISGDKVEQINNMDDGSELQFIQLEPEVITGLYDKELEERRVIRLYEAPSLLIKALLAAEDQRFFEHEGIDPLRILGAGWANFQARRTLQGGSTLTQQLVKNFFLTQERTLRRKLVEVCIALILEHHYSKLEILENYLNEIYLGQRGAKSILGMWEAARFYFGKEPRDLSVGEMALLAGMVKAPNIYAPTRHPEAAVQRRNYVLQRMYELSNITQEEYNAALQEKISLRKLPPDVNGAPYFADFIREELEKNYPSEALTSAGLHVFTSLDMNLQRIAQEVVRQGVEELEVKHPHLRREKLEERLQACLVAMRPQTGEILAMVGGRDYQTSQFNRVTQAHRQPGSVFKPIVYLTALAKEQEQREGRFLPTSSLLDAPFSWSFGDQVWSPGNYNNRYYGTVSLRRALEQSLNAATARLAKMVGLRSIHDMAQRLGWESPLPLYPSMVLGSSEVTPYEIVSMFSVLANQGVRMTPMPIKRILNPEGETIQRQSLQPEQVVSPEVAYMMTHLMEGVLENGTAREARKMGFLRPAAGKTGTTNDYGDAWFVGYTPNLVVAVWVGFDHRESLHLSGGQAALPIWTDFMKRATEEQFVHCFLPPPGIALRRRMALDEQVATPYCPAVTEEAFYRTEESPQPEAQPRFDTVPIGTSSSISSPTMSRTSSQQSSSPVSTPPSSGTPSHEVGERQPWWRLF
jgi:penicillin-binding protein 1B